MLHEECRPVFLEADIYCDINCSRTIQNCYISILDRQLPFRFGTKSQLIFDWQQILHSEPVTLHYRRTLRWYGQRTLRPSKVELSIEEHFGYAAGDPTPLLIAKLRLPDVSHLVASNVQNPPAIRPNRLYSIGSSSSGHNSAASADAVATSKSNVQTAG